MENEMMESAFKALSDATRLQIITFLSQMNRGKAVVDEDGCVHEGSTKDDICCNLAEPSSKYITIPEHLHELEAAGLISIGRKDDLMICALRPYTFKALAEELIAIAKGKEQNGCS